jgi:hypothetical protein
MRDGAPQIGQPRRHDTMVDHQVLESKLGLVSHLKNSLSIASRGGETAGDLPKNCHVLPSIAILEPQNRYDRFNSFLALRGRAGQFGLPAEHREPTRPREKE